MATIRDVAKEAGVSRATVTRALNEPKKVSPERLEKVEAAIEKLGYRPNMLSQTFRSNRARSLVVLAPNLANPFFSKVISGVVTASEERGYRVLVGDTDNNPDREAEFIRMVETRLADGVIQLTPYADSNESLLPRDHVPAVSVAGAPGTPYPSVRIDNRAAARDCVLHLAARGHQRIGVITGPASNSNTKARLEGYRQGLEEADIPYRDAWVQEGDFRLKSGLQAVEAFMMLQQQERPTAIFCMNDEMAMGAIKGLSQNGLEVPEDVSVVGFDDLEFSAFLQPALTTIAQPAYEMGYQSAELLIDMLDEGGSIDCHDIVLPYKFILRDST